MRDEDEFKTPIREFDEKHLICDIILLGEDGAIRRIVINNEVEEWPAPTYQMLDLAIAITSRTPIRNATARITRNADTIKPQ